MAVSMLSGPAFATGRPAEPAEPSMMAEEAAGAEHAAPTPATEAPPQATAESAPSSAPASQPRRPRVIWAESGQAPSRPYTRVVSEEVPTPRRRRLLQRVRWLVGLERAASIAGYRASTHVPGPDIVTSGVDASIIADVRQEPLTPLVMPRLSLDRRWSNGFSLGGAFSYAAHSAEERSAEDRHSLPSSESGLIGPRVGWFRALSGNTAVWLRGGITWAMRAASDYGAEPNDLHTFIEQHWAFSLEPQLVLMPLRHVGLSLGGALDLGFGGEVKTTNGRDRRSDTSRMPETASTYGLTAGLLVVF